MATRSFDDLLPRLLASAEEDTGSSGAAVWRRSHEVYELHAATGSSVLWRQTLGRDLQFLRRREETVGGAIDVEFVDLCLGPSDRAVDVYQLFQLDQWGVLALASGPLEIARSERTVRVERHVAVLTAALNATLLASAMSRELSLAQEVQRHLLPESKPSVDTLDIAIEYRPLMTVGGDLYDFVSLPSGDLGIIIADVAGKGLGAALMMAQLRTALHNAVLHSSADLGNVMARLNKLAFDASPIGRFLTLFYCDYDIQRGRLHYVNAGHNPPLICRGTGQMRRFRVLDVGGKPLGMFPTESYQQATATIGSGDLFVAYTDGLTEGRDRSGDEWGVERLFDSLSQLPESASANEALISIMEAHDNFTEKEPVDDVTVVVIRAL